jgi:hypothetical protein
LQIDEVTKEASNILGENGLIRAANQHSCTQCTQKYKATSDINISADPAAVAGVDNNQTVPPMVHSNPESSTSNSVPREDVQTDVMENEQAVVKFVLETWKMPRVEFSAQFIAYNMLNFTLPHLVHADS